MAGELILVVEDNFDSRDMVKILLTLRGYRVIEAVNGREAVNICMAAGKDGPQPDLILMDLSLPILDGWQAARMIRALPEFVSRPIVALTANVLSDDRDLALQAGCSAYLTKPITINALVSMVEQQLAEYHSSPATLPPQPSAPSN